MKSSDFENKAYGLASAVIAAFFLMGGVASADEVTQPTTSDTTAHVVTSPTEASADTATVASGEEVSANNATVENTVANTATTNTVTETPVATVEAPTVASGESVSAIDANSGDASTTNVTENTQSTFANANDSVSATNSGTVTNESPSNKTITATLTVPADRTVTASSATDDARLLDKAKEQVINLNVSGEGSLPAKSRIEIEVTTDIESNRDRILDNDLAASSSKKIVDNKNGRTYKSVIDISGLQAGLQKEMIVKPNSLLADEVTIKPMHRFTTYNLYVGDELVSSKKVTETFISKSPVISTESILNTLTIVKQSDGRMLESFTKDKQFLTII